MLNVCCFVLSLYSTSDKAADVGSELCTNPKVKKISFTGSTGVGKQLMKLSSDTVKRLSLGEYLLV
jgi:succinate-semialdehyde dehydrogenase / glutarate-semialdehyde dehydrogenase